MEPSAELIQVLESNRVTLCLKGTNGRYMGITPAGSRMAGRTVEQIIGKSDFEIFDKTSAMRIIQGDTEAINGCDPVSYFNTATVAGHRKLTYYSIKTSMRNARGEHRALLALVFEPGRDLKQNEDLVRLCEALMRYRAHEVERLAISMVLYSNLKKIAAAAAV